VLRAIRPEGRDDDVLVLPGRVGAGAVRVLPLAIGSVVEEVPGVVRWQLEQTAPDRLAVRLSVAPDRDRAEVWASVESRLHAWLAAQGVVGVEPVLDAAEPGRNPRSGKYRAVSAGRAAARA
jgi:phenylacetate-coenzyme A ligase PaaK-like adenylate-forming protein